MTQKQNANKTIAVNRKAHHEFFFEERFEAGIALQGWEVKSLRAGKVQLDQAYVIIKNGEAWLFGGQISPLLTAGTHIIPDPQRTRKLLLHQQELNKLIGHVERKGYTLVPLSLYWKNNHIKLEIALAKGKKQQDKRETIKRRIHDRESAAAMKSHQRKGR